MKQGELLRQWVKDLGFATISDFVRERTGEEPQSSSGKAYMMRLNRLLQKETFSSQNWKALNEIIPELTKKDLESAKPEEAPTLKEVLQLIEEKEARDRETFQTILAGIQELARTIEELKPDAKKEKH